MFIRHPFQLDQHLLTVTGLISNRLLVSLLLTGNPYYWTFPWRVLILCKIGGKIFEHLRETYFTQMLKDFFRRFCTELP
jgi:hypothetical protein